MLSVNFSRRQFPIRLAFAMTINKSQVIFFVHQRSKYIAFFQPSCSTLTLLGSNVRLRRRLFTAIRLFPRTIIRSLFPRPTYGLPANPTSTKLQQTHEKYRFQRNLYITLRRYSFSVYFKIKYVLSIIHVVTAL